MDHREKAAVRLCLWALALGALFITMTLRIGELNAENVALMEDLADTRFAATVEMQHHNAELELAWDEHADCEADSLELLEDDSGACPNPDDVCGRKLDVCYSYCVEGQPTVVQEFAMCQAWLKGFSQRESDFSLPPGGHP